MFNSLMFRAAIPTSPSLELNDCRPPTMAPLFYLSCARLIGVFYNASFSHKLGSRPYLTFVLSSNECSLCQCSVNMNEIICI